MFLSLNPNLKKERMNLIPLKTGLSLFSGAHFDLRYHIFTIFGMEETDCSNCKCIKTHFMTLKQSCEKL